MFHSEANFPIHQLTSGVNVISGDASEVLKEIKSGSIQSIVTSPPYWGVRDYGYEGQLGAEFDLMEYVTRLGQIFDECYRILKPDGTFWLNIANTYTSGGRKWRQEDDKNKGRAMSYRPPTPDGLKKKDLIGVAWLVAMECQRRGWYLRNDIIWNKPNCQPESVKDRLTVSHEYLFMFSKSENYFFDQEAIKEKGVNGNYRNKRTVWDVNTKPFPDAHFAVFPEALVRPCILASSKPGDIILDPFFGSGTVGVVAVKTGRGTLGIEMNPEYIEISRKRLASAQSTLFIA